VRAQVGESHDRAEHGARINVQDGDERHDVERRV
jgi:hypothetical protein